MKHWINARGGLTPHMIFLRGKELQALYKPCYLDAQASATKTPVDPRLAIKTSAAARRPPRLQRRPEVTHIPSA